LLAVDAYEFQQLPPSLAYGEVKGTALYDALGHVIKQPANAAYGNAGGQDPTCEHKPHFHEWATATPGMICVARRARNASFRNYVAAETASPVICCAAGQPKIMEDQVEHSKSNLFYAASQHALVSRDTAAFCAVLLCRGLPFKKCPSCG
jgi:hypothetical protein